MVSSGTVNGDSSKIMSALSACNTGVSGLSGGWEGASHDNLVSKFGEFYGEASSVQDSMSSFACALDLYIEYQAKKQEIKEARSKLNNISDDDENASSKRSSYRNKISNYEDELEKIGKKIKSELSSVKTIKGASTSGSASIDGSSLQTISSDGFLPASNVVEQGDNMMLNCNMDDIMNKFGGQNDNTGVYARNTSGCDDYSRGYCIYAQTGKVVDAQSISVNGGGLQCKSVHPSSRKEQAEFAYERLVKEGKPSVIHVNSRTGNGHWMTVVGVNKNVNKESVQISDLVVIDPAGNWNGSNSSKLRRCSEDSYYCSEGANQRYDPGYQVFYFDK